MFVSSNIASQVIGDFSRFCINFVASCAAARGISCLLYIFFNINQYFVSVNHWSPLVLYAHDRIWDQYRNYEQVKDPGDYNSLAAVI